MVNVCLLGTGGMMPLPNRWLTAMLASYEGKMILIDCGEGTQITLKKLKWGFKAIEAICFTHYHADHIAGLPGLLLTIANAGRREPLTLIGPLGLKNVVEGLMVIAPNLPFSLHTIEVSQEKKERIAIYNTHIHTLPVDHTLPCLAYSIHFPRRRRFDPQKAQEENIPKLFWNRLHKGETIKIEDREITADMVLGKERKGVKIAYCTDTRPVKSLSDFVEEADLFICEGMYGEEAQLPKALENKHMLFSEAAMVAKEGRVKELWLTHYSPSLIKPEDFLEDTRQIFYPTFLGEDGMIKELNFPEEE